MSTPPVKQCPLQPDYKFRTQCRIRTCRNFTPCTESRCLALDTRFSSDDKTVSDGELLRYKFGDKEMSVKDVTKIRKRAVDSVMSSLSLYRLISAIMERHSREEGFAYVPGQSEIVDRVVTSKPLRIKLLRFEPWMLKFLLDTDFVSGVLETKFKVKDALRLKPAEYTELLNAIYNPK